jgi:hypothetical protein
MNVSIRFVDGSERPVEVDLDEWTKGFRKALANGEVLEIKDKDGARLGINPRAVLYWESVDGAVPLSGS